MDFKKEFVTNKALEEGGVWVDIGSDASLKVARAGNKKSIARYRELAAPYIAQITHGKISDDIAVQISVQVQAETILLDWKGISYDGKAMEYSTENAVKLLTESPDFRELVATISNERRTFQQQIDEVITKN